MWKTLVFTLQIRRSSFSQIIKYTVVYCELELPRPKREKQTTSLQTTAQAVWQAVWR